MTVWQLIEDAPFTLADTCALYDWSTNFDPGHGPFVLFLDLIGWSGENYGEAFYDLSDASLGYMELEKLGRALSEYVCRPRDVRDFVDALMEAEAEA